MLYKEVIRNNYKMWYNHFLSNNTSNNYEEDKRTITTLDIFIMLIFASFGSFVVFIYLKCLKKK